MPVFVSEPHQPLTRRQLREIEVGAKGRRPAPVVALQRPKKSLRERAAGKLLSLGAMVFAGALMIGMSVPANAFYIPPPPEQLATAVADAMPPQSLAVSSVAVSGTAARDAFGVTSYAEQLKLKYPNRTYEYATTTGAVRWPFPYPVPISSGFGEREAPCSGCSSTHNGLDFTPGEGVPTYAVADGVVSFVSDSEYGYGTHVIIDHVINGQNVQSLYAHLQFASSPLVIGTPVLVGDFVGLVGDTGTAVGAHLHFEIRLDDVMIDPYPWLQTNAVN